MEALRTLLLNIANLFKVKTILSIGVIATTCYLTIKEVKEWIEDLFFTEEEVKVLDHWLKGDSI